MQQQLYPRTRFGFIAACIAWSVWVPAAQSSSKATQATTPGTIALSGIVRDFRKSHVDFAIVPDGGHGHYAGNVEFSQGTDPTPIFTGNGFKVTSQWRDVVGRPITPQVLQSDETATYNPRSSFFYTGHSFDFWEPAPQVVVDIGTPWCPMMMNWRTRNDDDWHDISDQDRIDDTINRQGLSRDYEGKYVIDYEPYIKGATPRWNNDVPYYYVELIEKVRNRLPKAQIAVFGLPTIWVWEENSTEKRRLTAEELDIVYAAVDFLAPRFYTTSLTWEDIDRRRTKAAWSYVQSTNALQKPVVPVIGSHKIQSREGIPPEVVVKRSQFLKKMGAVGTIVWGNPAREADEHWADIMSALMAEFGGATSLTGLYDLEDVGLEYDFDIGEQRPDNPKPVMAETFVEESSKINKRTRRTRIKKRRKSRAHQIKGDTAGVRGVISTAGISSASSFNEWYNDVLGTNIATTHTITLADDGHGVYEFNEDEFHPIDDRLLGNEGDAHNHYFTYEITFQFVYSAGTKQFFEFAGDDDAWVFVDGCIGIDLGGVVPGVRQHLDLARMGLVEAETYTLRFYYAQRQSGVSRFNIRTNITPVPAMVAKVISPIFD